MGVAADKSAREGTLVFGFVNWISILGAMYATKLYGRKTIHILGFLGLTISLYLIGVTIGNNDVSLVKIFVVVYTIIF